jgi:hypothetical protein
MKRIIFTSLLIFGLAYSSMSQGSAAAKVKDNPNAAEMTFTSEFHDYGTIKQGDNGTCEFKFKNTGKEPLIISNARGSCGCTVPTWPKEPIIKGETSAIQVHYDTKRIGAFTKTVTIESNAKTSPKVITIKGVVEASEDASNQSLPFNRTSEDMPLEKNNKQ